MCIINRLLLQLFKDSKIALHTLTGVLHTLFLKFSKKNSEKGTKECNAFKVTGIIFSGAFPKIFTALNSVISPNFLGVEICEKAEFPRPFPQNFLTKN